MDEFDLNRLKYSYENGKYNLEELYNWILENVEFNVGTEQDEIDSAYSLIDDLFEASSYNKILTKNGTWINYYKLREEFNR